MLNERPYSQSELKRLMKRFLEDENRRISVKMFGELCGYSREHLYSVFKYETEPVTIPMQIRASKALRSLERGEIAVMRNQDNTRFVQYRKEPKPALARSTGLQVVDGQIRMKIGIKNHNDYSVPSLDEQMRR